MKPQSELAQKLYETGNWAGGRAARPPNSNIDRNRVNIVSETLCDDILEYIGSTLDRHKGCDLIDVFPGPGVWSTALHNLLQPRSHLLLEPDMEYYRPFLEPLLQRPGTKLLPESGIVWEQLNRVLNPTHLPHQVERKYTAADTPLRNDTLLVTMNLAMFPKRKFRSFESVVQLVLFQMISSIRPGALFQKYGLVRLLLWTPDTEKNPLLPRTVQQRKKMAVEAELSTDYVCEVAGGELEDSITATRSAPWFTRDESMDLESTLRTRTRMQETGFALPPGREPLHVVKAVQMEEAGREAVLDPERMPRRAAMNQLRELEEAVAAGKIEHGTEEYKTWRRLLSVRKGLTVRSHLVVKMLKERDAATQAFIDAGDDPELRAAAQKRCDKWSDEIDKLEKTLQTEIRLVRDNLHVLQQEPPIMNWDRRYVEPLRARPDEFYPQIPCSLLDIQPKAAATLLREMGPGSTRGGDTFDLIMRGMNQRFAEPVPKLLDTIYSGAGDGVPPLCPSLLDPKVGGSPLPRSGGLSARTLSQDQLVEVGKAWMRWPFRPSYQELVSRTLEDFGDDDMDESSGRVGHVSSRDF
ncbi:hypothetical protein C8A05DRAFT_16000 [Staphylotrichum tortipilum]|uniref:Mitochondrial transcription factor 1 n=1 Tax=Staphylotrichum tortipilum TaxID=2831512 RepID=A0AAN6RTT4_9PEZI|nr:hypothetical protein C8A05DRAFT_16000 [Staphylotrichum longicolle]